jgi:anti-sigma B factor antagonist
MEHTSVMEIRTQDGVVVVQFNTATIDASEGFEKIAQELRQVVSEHKPPKMVVDFGRVVFFSSHMLGLLVDVWRRLKDCGGLLVISGINPTLNRVFRITNLDKVFMFYPDINSALKALAPPAQV